MKLIELNNISENLSWDSSDNTYDAVVHIELDRDLLSETDPLYEFTKKVYEKVDIVKLFDGAYCSIVCNWEKLFKDNIELWLKITKKYWTSGYHNLYKEDEDEYIYELIKSMDEWLAGYTDDDTYLELIKVLDKC